LEFSQASLNLQGLIGECKSSVTQNDQRRVKIYGRRQVDDINHCIKNTPLDATFILSLILSWLSIAIKIEFISSFKF